MTRKNQPNFLQHGPYRVWYKREPIKLAHGSTEMVLREVRIIDLRTAKPVAIFPPSVENNEDNIRDAMNMAWLLANQEATNAEIDFDVLKAPYARAVLQIYSDASRS